LQENDQIDITTENGSIAIRKAARKHRAIKSLAERFEGYTGGYQCFEADTGKQAGLETAYQPKQGGINYKSFL
jgi:antitoxin component of MazEF toxin-antitoxin module